MVATAGVASRAGSAASRAGSAASGAESDASGAGAAGAGGAAAAAAAAAAALEAGADGGSTDVKTKDTSGVFAAVVTSGASSDTIASSSSSSPSEPSAAAPESASVSRIWSFASRRSLSHEARPSRGISEAARALQRLGSWCSGTGARGPALASAAARSSSESSPSSSKSPPPRSWRRDGDSLREKISVRSGLVGGGKPPWVRIAQRPSFSAWRPTIVSSIVPRPTRRMTVHARDWPMRWMRMAACSSCAGFHEGFSKIMKFAPMSVTPSRFWTVASMHRASSSFRDRRFAERVAADCSPVCQTQKPGAGQRDLRRGGPVARAATPATRTLVRDRIQFAMMTSGILNDDATTTLPRVLVKMSVKITAAACSLPLSSSTRSGLSGQGRKTRSADSFSAPEFSSDACTQSFWSAPTSTRAFAVAAPPRAAARSQSWS